MNYPDLFLLLAILVIVSSVKYRKVKAVWCTWTLFLFIPIGFIAIILTLLGIDISSKSRVEKQERARRIQRKRIAINRATRLAIAPIRKTNHVLIMSCYAIQRIAEKDREQARKRSILNPFAYISVWNPILGLWRANRDVVRNIKANPNAALRGLRSGMYLANFLRRL